MVFKKIDVGANARKWDKNDCTVRATMIAMNMTYLNAWDFLYDLQRLHRTCSFRLADFLRRTPQAFNVVEKIPCKAVKGHPRTTGATFALQHPKGRYILRMAHHVVAVVDGTLYDSWDSTGRCVYSAWKVQP